MIDQQDASLPLVLVIDDEVEVRSVIGRALQRNGYRALLTSSGSEGIAEFEKHAAEIGVVVLDWHLPGEPGEKTFDELIARQPGLRVVLVTGDHSAELGPVARKHLACMLLKPFTTAELLLSVSAVLQA